MKLLTEKEAKRAMRALKAMRPFLPLIEPKYSIWDMSDEDASGFGLRFQSADTNYDRERMDAALKGTHLVLIRDGREAYVVHR